MYFTFALLLFGSNTFAQKQLYRNNPYKVKVYIQNSKKPIKAILYDVTDSTIILVFRKGFIELKNNNAVEDKIVIAINQINKIEYWKKNRIINTLQIGVGTGALIGLLIEPNTSSFITLNREVQAIIGAYGGLFYSGIYSVVRSFFKQEIIINANIETFNAQKNFLDKHTALKLI